ncbi:MAG TPA: MFS transporter [Ktedonobacterales bacterium]
MKSTESNRRSSPSKRDAATPQVAGSGTDEQLPQLAGSPRRGWLAGTTAGITRIVIVLGVIALFTDMSSEMIVPLRLLFLVQVLGTPLTLAGLIEGLAEGAASLLKIASGRMADRVSSRRALITSGYAFSNLTKPLLALVTNWPIALGLILLDRSGKAIRSSPRDAMLADSVLPSQRGKAFGFHRSADTLGAAIGPLLALAILAATGGNLRAVFAWTLAPGLVAIVVAAFFLRDPRRGSQTKTEVSGHGDVSAHSWQRLGAKFWLFTAAAVIFAFGNSSDAFLFLRSEGLEASLIAVPALYFAFNMVYALLATPLGSLSDRFGRLPVLTAGYAAFALVYLGWTQAHAGWQAWALFLVYGVYYAATEGVARAFVADLVPGARRGSALGWFNGLTGIAALPANIAGGWLWSQFGPSATFGLGAWLGVVACGLLIAWWPWLRTEAAFPQ